MRKEEIIIEFGSSQPIEFAKATMYDSEDKEIDIPICEKCGLGKTMIIGKTCFQWFCSNCPNEE